MAVLWPSSALALPSEFQGIRDVFLNELSKAVPEATQGSEMNGRDPRLFAWIYLGSIGGAVTEFFCFGRPALNSELADALVAAIFKGWRDSNQTA